jgi:hypothetical protein
MFLWGFSPRIHPSDIPVALIRRLLDDCPNIAAIKAEGGFPSIQSIVECDRLFGKERGFQQGTMICALGKLIRRFHSRLPFHSTSCSGDSGGPVIADTPAGARLVGLVSAGPFPCGLGGPSVYARVASRLGFIRRAAGLP